ncbi:MAG: serine hydrolase, partial [Hyphomicrobiales bacterium]
WDYSRFAQMLLRGGEVDGRRYLTAETVAEMTKARTGELSPAFVQGTFYGLGCAVIRDPGGPTAALNAGSFGHGGVFGTQAWIDPVKGRYYILMVQRSNLGNGDASDLRRFFQDAAAK